MSLPGERRRFAGELGIRRDHASDSDLRITHNLIRLALRFV
jgi:hypothetical protein